jgi:hypothetical protein
MTEQFAIAYEFTLPDGDQERFDLSFDANTIELISNPPPSKPFWSKLEFEQCPHCPLSSSRHQYCPVALNLVPAIDSFDHLMSFEEITIRVICENRTVIQKTSAQEGISSLMGLLIAGSSCPVTHFFKPMARFHLPFANRKETIWRATASYLMAKYFTRDGLTVSDMTLNGLAKIYNDVARLNDAVVQRLRAATNRDSTVNALVHLDVFAKFLTPPLEDSLAQLESIFEPFLITLRR